MKKKIKKIGAFSQSTVTLERPKVTISHWDERAPMLIVEEDSIEVQLEFTTEEGLNSFKEEVAKLQIKLPKDT